MLSLDVIALRRLLDRLMAWLSRKRTPPGAAIANPPVEPVADIRLSMIEDVCRMSRHYDLALGFSEDGGRFRLTRHGKAEFPNDLSRTSLHEVHGYLKSLDRVRQQVPVTRKPRPRQTAYASAPAAA